METKNLRKKDMPCNEGKHLTLKELRKGMRLEGTASSNYCQLIVTNTHSDYVLAKSTVMNVPVILTEQDMPMEVVNG